MVSVHHTEFMLLAADSVVQSTGHFHNCDLFYVMQATQRNVLISCHCLFPGFKKLFEKQ